MDFGERLQGLRKGKNMTQDELASKVNVSRPALAKWEKNMCEPSAETLVKLSEIFGVSLEYLLTGKNTDKESGAIIVQKVPRHISKPVIAASAVFIVALIIFVVLLINVSQPDYRGDTLWSGTNYWLAHHNDIWQKVLLTISVMVAALCVIVLYDIFKQFLESASKTSNVVFVCSIVAVAAFACSVLIGLLMFYCSGNPLASYSLWINETIIPQWHEKYPFWTPCVIISAIIFILSIAGIIVCNHFIKKTIDKQ